MNERIRELYKQAAQFGQDDYNNRRRNRGPLYEEDELTNIVNQKFAELIVRECANVCQQFGNGGSGYTLSSEIREHFGVRE
jgi:hypothetical protein